MEEETKKPKKKNENKIIEKAEIVSTKNPLKETKSLLVAVIRIKGEVNVKPEIKNTLDRLRLRRKYACVLIDLKNKNYYGMINTIKYSVAYGEIDEDTLGKLIEARGKKIDNEKFDSKKIAKEILSGKTLNELGFKPFFRLHPPRKGIKSKLQYPKGALGNHHKDINKLIERML